jgi:hypothetical protein
LGQFDRITQFTKKNDYTTISKIIQPRFSRLCMESEIRFKCLTLQKYWILIGSYLGFFFGDLPTVITEV